MYMSELDRTENIFLLEDLDEKEAVHFPPTTSPENASQTPLHSVFHQIHPLIVPQVSSIVPQVSLIVPQVSLIEPQVS